MKNVTYRLTVTRKALKSEEEIARIAAIADENDRKQILHVDFPFSRNQQVRDTVPAPYETVGVIEIELTPAQYAAVVKAVLAATADAAEYRDAQG